ncbi:NlpC/P60 family protein [Shimia sp. SDUM112013]|uniref:C40 family peptidase n=1 Tax=Shimia sp. SDUM112013 TaxID=3136160 RepID=UPI0032ED4A23
MTDRRFLRSNGRVACTSLQGSVTVDHFVEGVRHRVRTPRTPLLAAPDAPTRDRELLFGQGFVVLETRDGHSFGYSTKDGYVGYVPHADLRPWDGATTHTVQVRQSFGKAGPDFKQRDEILPLFHAARLTVQKIEGKWARCTGPDGASIYVPHTHLRPVDHPETDPAAVAARYLGAFYLWGGNSSVGIDCSGLVQAAFLACGLECPGDSDLQASEVGTPLPEDAAHRRGDLLFWKGHVAMVVDDTTLIHANAHHMSVVYEPITAAIDRIGAQGDGPVTARRRPSQPMES